MKALMLVVRVLATVLNGPMIIIGCIWILQGLNLLPGSFMTGDIKWAIFGAGMAACGLAIVFWLNRRRR